MYATSLDSVVSLRIIKHESAKGFLNRAQSWLLQSEAENNLILGIAAGMAERGDWDVDVLLATVESDGYVVGCAFRTPPYKVGISRMPLKAVPPLTEVIGDCYEKLPGVLGPLEEARYLARSWCGPRGLNFRPSMNQRIYALDELVAPESFPGGAMREASSRDRPHVTEWLRRFFDETEMPIRNAEELAERLLPEHSMFIWVADGIDVSMAGITGRTPNGVRIGFVYTPPEFRRNGYGTAITAALTDKMLGEGKRFCFLFTDAANPASNSIYQKLGYRPVGDVVDYLFF